MTSKILSNSGNSLADIYDVEGSIAGIERLETHDLPIVHEMGQTVFSERFSTAFIRVTSGAINQNTSFDIVSTGLQDVPQRVVAVMVFSNNAGRVLRCGILARESRTGREMPFWIYDGANFIVTRMEDQGGGVGLLEVLLGNAQATILPIFTGGDNQPFSIADIAFRGTSTGFGAGTVIITALYFLAYAEAVGSGIDSRGLPIPSW